MTFQDAFNEIKGIFSHANVQDYRGHLAIQVTMTGEGGGTFYIEFSDGNVAIEPMTITTTMFGLFLILTTFCR